MNLSNVCRICLLINKDCKQLFSDTIECIKILQNINLCFRVVLSNENNLPYKICCGCLKELELANNFRIKCLTFEERFRALCDQYEKRDSTENINFDNASLPYYDSVDFTSGKESEYEKRNEENLMNNATNGATIYKCDLCDKTLKTKKSFAKHIISMHQQRKHVGRVTGTGINRKYHCTQCSYRTPHSQTLVNHMRRHSGERPYHCNCGKSFTQASSLSSHQKTHNTDAQFTCATCGKQFKHAFSLKKHMRVHETGSFACNICQNILKSQQSLQEHMYRHYSIHNFNCEDCGATFVSSSELINHKRTHILEKNAVCHLCGYKTKAKKNLTVHLKRHAGEKPFSCGLCTSAFYTSSDLQRHQRVHSHQKPFPCPTCAQRFSHSTSLNKHMKNVHGTHYKWADFKALNLKNTILKDDGLIKPQL